MLDLWHVVLGAAAVFAGGVLGGYTRWILMREIHNPLASTFAANIAAAAIIGFAVATPAAWRTAVGVGYAGALSTLSMLASQLGEMVKAGRFGAALKYGLGTAFAAAAATGIGVYWATVGVG